MKTLLTLLLVAALGGVYWFRREAADAEAQIAAAVEAKEAAEQSAERARQAAADAEARLAAMAAAHDDKAADRQARSQRIAEIERIYQQQKAELAEQEAGIVSRLTLASDRLAQMKAAKPTFSEQRTRYSSTAGRSIASGIRTSAADRGEVVEKWQAEVDAATAEVAAIEGERTLHRRKLEQLEEQYRSARARARQ